MAGAAEYRREERSNQAGQTSVVHERRKRTFANFIQCVNQRSSCSAGELSASTACSKEQNQSARNHEGQHCTDNTLWHVLLWICRFFRCQGNALNSEEQPNTKWESRNHTGNTERQKCRTPIYGRGDIEEIRHFEVRRNANNESDKGDHGNSSNAKYDL